MTRPAGVSAGAISKQRCEEMLVRFDCPACGGSHSFDMPETEIHMTCSTTHKVIKLRVTPGGGYQIGGGARRPDRRLVRRAGCEQDFCFDTLEIGLTRKIAVCHCCVSSANVPDRPEGHCSQSRGTPAE